MLKSRIRDEKFSLMDIQKKRPLVLVATFIHEQNNTSMIHMNV